MLKLRLVTASLILMSLVAGCDRNQDAGSSEVAIENYCDPDYVPGEGGFYSRSGCHPLPKELRDHYSAISVKAIQAQLGRRAEILVEFIEDCGSTIEGYYINCSFPNTHPTWAWYVEINKDTGEIIADPPL